MVTLGALVAATGVLPLEAVAHALRDHLPKSKQKMLEPNLHALSRGAEQAETVFLFSD
jgi:Pyruvate/2-oxoacid:ferredoxin oxidoreductase gamma subunit